MALDHVDLDDDRLVALVGDDDAAALLAPAALGLGLLGAGDRLARRGLLAHGLRARAARRARDVLARALLLGRRAAGSSAVSASAAGASAAVSAARTPRLGSRLCLGVGLGVSASGSRPRAQAASAGAAALRPRQLPRARPRRGRLDHGLLDLGRLFGCLVLLLLRQPFSSAPSACLGGTSVVLHGQDPRDLALRELEARRVLERTGRRLEAEVEQLLPRVGEPVSQLVVVQVAQVPSPQRDHRPRHA